MNKLIVVGFPGQIKCYLNVSKEEAIERYCNFYSMSETEFLSLINKFWMAVTEIVFEDEFEIYEISF